VAQTARSRWCLRHVALYAQADGETHQYYSIATAQWAKQWPVEDLWAARLTP
jgi:hypothetical protein